MFPHPQQPTAGAWKFAENFGEFFIVWGRGEISRIIRLIIAKAIIAHSSKMGKEIRQPEAPQSSTFWFWFPLRCNRFLCAFFIPLCVDIPIPETRVKLSTNVTLSNPVFGLWHEFVLPFQNREKNMVQRNHFLLQKRYIWSIHRQDTNDRFLRYLLSFPLFFLKEWMINILIFNYISYLLL